MNGIPRPSHADFTYKEKYGVTVSSGGGRASARETIGSFPWINAFQTRSYRRKDANTMDLDPQKVASLLVLSLRSG
jgi:hypothetical protein